MVYFQSRPHRGYREATYLDGTLRSPGSSSRSSEDRTAPAATNNELSTWSTCFRFSFFLLLIDSSTTFASKGFATGSKPGESWDCKTKQPKASQYSHGDAHTASAPAQPILGPVDPVSLPLAPDPWAEFKRWNTNCESFRIRTSRFQVM